MSAWRVDDVMTKAVVSVQPTATYREVVDLLIGRRFSAVPVVDGFEHVTGVISEADLLRKIEYAGEDAPRLFEGRRRRGERAKAHAATAADLMSSPPVVALSGTPIAAAARVMDVEHVKRLPVVDDLGRLIGIVSRGDLLKVHLRPDDEISADICRNVFDVLLPDGSEQVDVAVAEGVVRLTGPIDRRSTANMAIRLTRQVPGVVDVIDKFNVAFQDTDTTGASVFIVA
ncbi:CBS domain-containing protein [Micromonospora inaquosa]|uniref:CBS domain-containing protein n=1 Tax=Micromonospora inaquosa TaxID=2203716 RepID=UPI001FCA42D2|nr:CBS domain-containing protein [Micromonospora inaquosa]